MDAIKKGATDRLRALTQPRLETSMNVSSVPSSSAVDPVVQLLVAATQDVHANPRPIRIDNQVKNGSAPVTSLLVPASLPVPIPANPPPEGLVGAGDEPNADGSEEPDPDGGKASTHKDDDYRPAEATQKKKRHHSRTSAIFSVEDKAKIVAFASRPDIQWLLRKENRIQTKEFCTQSGYDYETVCVWASSNTPKDRRLSLQSGSSRASAGSASLGSGGSGGSESQSTNTSQESSEGEVGADPPVPKRPKRVRRSPAHRMDSLEDSLPMITSTESTHAVVAHTPPQSMMVASMLKPSRSSVTAEPSRSSGTAEPSRSSGTAEPSRSSGTAEPPAPAPAPALVSAAARSTSPLARSMSPPATHTVGATSVKSPLSLGSRGSGGAGGAGGAPPSHEVSRASPISRPATASIQQLILKKEAHLKAREDQLKADEAALELIKSKQEEWRKKTQELADREAKILAAKAQWTDLLNGMDS